MTVLDYRLTVIKKLGTILYFDLSSIIADDS